MNFVDLLIVYLACGSPFAVYQATTRENGPQSRRFARIAFSLFLWPVIAAGSVKARLQRAFSGGLTVKDLENIRNEIEEVLFPDGSSSNVFEFRDSFYRFAGLEQASTEVPSNASFEIFKVSKHPNAALASRVLGRKNSKRIEAHKLRAREEFSDVLQSNLAAEIDTDLRASIARLSSELQITAPSRRPTANISAAPASSVVK